jgi:hypothetical protein
MLPVITPAFAFMPPAPLLTLIFDIIFRYCADISIADGH